MRSSSASYLFAGTLLAAAGYGATFLFSAYFRARGGSDVDTGIAFGAAMFGTFFGVALVGWFSGRFDSAWMASAAGLAIASGFLVLGLADVTNAALPRISAFLIGLGWGMFYIGAPLALSDRVGDGERAYWFTRFGAFQMAGIGLGPVLLDFAGSDLKVGIAATFLIVASLTGLSAILLMVFASRTPLVGRARAMRPWVRSIGPIASTSTVRPILMVGIGACVFSGLMSFQGSLVDGTNASPRSYFAVYAATVVGMRLSMARILAGIPQARLAACLLMLMCLGVWAMFGVKTHPSFQVLSAILTGIGYGLVYPIIQTWAVNHAPTDLRHAALTWFVLSYFVGIFGFPAVGGWILVHFGSGGLLRALLVAAILELALACVPRTRPERSVPHRL